ncbi:hypothetical protein [Agromyces atrinae]|uniref:Uncharacterized protein n=1 Tax=Agromyces atrinae TaxID=592376 RepID=A0A4Q2M898_9MICO|nr:hypothetical protein [Agromyces atrinae]NYD67014.1 hypothetical protein [Agromyces atrinae]RXZ85252.1 hypothetical protein ESP50_16225 [Agromyces atrinae]RXZ85360.1 hypothetical protein ESP50_15630 [Agromyces atrinae]
MIRAELGRLVSGITLPVLLVVAALLNALAVYGIAVGMKLDQIGDAAPAATQSLVTLGFGATLFAMIFGALSVTRDFGTTAIRRSAFLARGADRLLGARLVALSVPAAVFAVVGAGSAAAVTAIVFTANGTEPDFSGDTLTALGGVAANIVFATYIGHLVGWQSRRSVWTILGLVGYTLVLETLVISILPSVGRFLPGGAGQAMMIDSSTTDEILPLGAGYAVAAAWIVVLISLGVLRLRKTDLS